MRYVVAGCLVLGLLLAVAKGASALPPRLLEPGDGALLRGRVTISVEADPRTESMLFEWSRDGGASWEVIAFDTDGSDGWSSAWETRPFSGIVELRAIDSTGEQSDIRVRIDNRRPTIFLRERPASFSPNGDTIRDRTNLQIAADEVVQLTLQVVGPSGLVVDTLLRDTSLRSRVPRGLKWDGLIYGGSGRGRDGTYTLRALATDRVGNHASASIAVTVDTRAPRLAWYSLSPARISRGPVQARLGIADRSHSLDVEATLYDPVGAPLRRLGAFRHRPGPSRLTLRPLGAERLTPGRYEIGFVARDSAGNTSSMVRRPFLVVHPVRAHVWSRFLQDGRRVALTFDDCVDGRAWESILDTLAAYAVQATFFCPGRFVLANPRLALRTVREGHAIGSHGWDHADFGSLSYDSALARLISDREVWWRLAKRSPLPFFRPPYGRYTASTVAACGEAGYAAVVLWDVDPFDWAAPGVDAIIERTVGPTRPGSIDLLHTVAQTAIALPAIIERLRLRGFELVSLPQLAAAGSPSSGYWPSY